MQDDFKQAKNSVVEDFSRHDFIAFITEICDGIDKKTHFVGLAAQNDYSFSGEEEMVAVERRARSVVALQIIAEEFGIKEDYAGHLERCTNDPTWFREQSFDLLTMLEKLCENEADRNADDLQYALDSFLIGFGRYGTGYEGQVSEHHDIARAHVKMHAHCTFLLSTLAKLRGALDFSDQDVFIKPLPKEAVALFPKPYDSNQDDDTNVCRFG